jgi:pyruvate,water dikinase
MDAGRGLTVLRPADSEASAVAHAGGKGTGLRRLQDLGLPVPPFAVLATGVHDAWRAGEPLPVAELGQLVGELGAPLAVRSSAVDEDAAGRSAAGQYESVMGVTGLEGLLQAIEHCYRAADDERARAYRGDAAPARVALVVQREIASDRAGVAFTADPLTGSSQEVLVEALFGHGEGAVSGELTPDRYRVRRAGLAVSARVADKPAAADGRGALVPLADERRAMRALRDDEARAVAELALRAEDGIGAPVDLEFCFGAGRLWALQCRPITTLA